MEAASLFVSTGLTQHVTLSTRGDQLLDVVVSDDAISVPYTQQCMVNENLSQVAFNPAGNT